ncbi:hypothetical protein BKP35_08275 [Anaerobacillus arseniciselenatis]|uniref:Uncharacterized protein n=1 Tax=Anaerobacillus arseniciselenatis TaxID=85682 RepID=A0A1S2LNR4_9BACI|nr:hypothetical protein BKP35_08275 [Anaerobacillus arseniciselenatis]
MFALVSSLLFPGLGHLYIHRIIEGFIFLSGTILIIYMSNFLVALQYTLLGSFTMGISVLDPQWALFLPSIYCFAAYEAYVLCVECNKAFKKEQKQFLQKSFQFPNYQLLESKEK